MAVLVTGGAGYIGSAFVELLRAVGEPLVVLDDLSAGHRDAVPADVPLYEGRVGDRRLVVELVGRHGVDVCVHFAGRIDVAESVAQPLRYYESNFVEGIALIDALTQAGVRRTVFSSTAAVYGSPRRIPICETDPCAPESPYGRSKLAFERCLTDLDAATGSASVIFRYFNAAGATDGCRERHQPETHLIPNALAAAAGTRSALRLFGTDFPTRDGTAERDYVHVADLADAHLRAVRHLRSGGGSCVLNLGGGTGTTVMEVIAAVERVTGRRVPVERVGRRAGDPSSLVADIEQAGATLGWSPRRSTLEEVIASAWQATHVGGG